MTPIITPTLAVTIGTNDETIARGSVMERYLPFRITGIFVPGQGVGTLAQEWWECAFQQRNMAAGLIAFFVLAVIAVLCGLPILYVAPGWLIASGLGSVVIGTYQTPGSEEFSHAVSVQASLAYDGATIAQAEHNFLDNLAGYQYSRPLSADNARKQYPAAKAWVDANAALMLRFQAIGRGAK